jgi:hypothetical protein
MPFKRFCNYSPVMGSWEYSLPSLALYGSVESNGGSYANMVTNGSIRGPGGGSGGTLLLFVLVVVEAEGEGFTSIGLIFLLEMSMFLLQLLKDRYLQGLG